MAHQVLITDLAKADLQEITEYIAQDNPAAAARFAQKLLEDTLSLAHSPYRGRALQRKRDVRRILRRPYLVYYRIEMNPDLVRMLRFWHGFRHPKTPQFED